MAIGQELRVLGRTIAELEEHALASRTRPSVHERLAAVHRAHSRRAATRWRASLAGPFVALGAVAAALLALWFSRAEPLQFAVGSTAEHGLLGAWVAASAETPTAITFSDGSQVLLSAGAQARVESVSAHGARVVVERGNVRANVVPRVKNDWWVVGGPFEIHVTGTSFDASWEPDRAALHVVMYEGHVEIRGACLPTARALSKGQAATLSCSPSGVIGAASAANGSGESGEQRAAAANPISASEGAVSAFAPLRAPPSAAPKSAPEKNEDSADTTSSLASAAPSWRAWAQLGGYKEALAAAEREGFDTLCDTLSLAELLELATTARLAGKAARANQAYSAIRKRFAGSDGAATAAFHLGQIAFDSARSYPDARRWFSAYLSERPEGALAAEALGRTMEAEQRLGDLAAAKLSAEKYLQRFPAGAHARLANSLLVP